MQQISQYERFRLTNYSYIVLVCLLYNIRYQQSKSSLVFLALFSKFYKQYIKQSPTLRPVGSTVRTEHENWQ